MIEVRNHTRTCKLGRVQVSGLVDVSLVIESRDLICIIDKSASGRSTLLRQLGFIDRPSVVDSDSGTTGRKPRMCSATSSDVSS